MSTSIDERVSGLPTDLEEGKSGEMQQKAPCYSQTAIPKYIQLKACPFCGSRAHVDRIAKPDAYSPAGYFAVTCIVCDATIDYRCNDPQEAAEKWNARATQDSKSALRGHSPELNQDSPASSLEPCLKADEAARPVFADASVIRTAIADVIDTPRHWEFYEDKRFGPRLELTEAEANEDRLKFADRVIQRIRELQSPPFNLGIKLENYCSRHIRERLPASTATVCADCMAEREEKK